MLGEAPKVLIIEDEQEIRRFLRVSLTSNGYECVEAETGGAGLMQARSQPFDLVLLDLGLPDMDGIGLIVQLRQSLELPIIILSARGQERDKIAALDAGANDYLTKPFSIGELLARLRVALRRPRGAADEAPENFSVRELAVDFEHRRVTVRGETLHLTPTEFRIFAMLVQHAGKVVTHRQLLTEIWGPDSAENAHSLRVYMARLRNKIEADAARPSYLLTEPGVGYRLSAD